MHRRLTFGLIEKEAEMLPPRKQLRLVEMLIRKLRAEKEKPAVKKLLHWPDLYGLGKGLWGKMDAQDYVGSLRENR